MHKLVDVVGGINLDLLNRARKVVSVLLKRERKYSIGIVLHDRGVFGTRQENQTLKQI